MGKRSTGRRLAMQAIFQMECSGITVEDALKGLLEEEDFIPETREFASTLALSAMEHKGEIDQIIHKLSKNWSLDRMNKVDISILRLAIYELSHTKVPPSVVINEAIELAKKYSTGEAAKFINGILGAFLKNK